MPIIVNNIQRGTLAFKGKGVSRAFKGANCIYQKSVAPLIEWSYDSSIVSGLPDVGYYAHNTVAQTSYGLLIMIWGSSNSLTKGYLWNGSNWVNNYDFMISLGSYPSMSVFERDGNMYMISVNYDGVFSGWIWGDPYWYSEPSIIYNLPSLGYAANQSVFQMNGTWYMIASDDDNIYGFRWDYDWWVADSSIISGLTGVFSYLYKITPFQLDGDWYLIVGIQDFYGFKWSGSAWAVNSDILFGLTDNWSKLIPSYYEINGVPHLVVGEYNGTFKGFKAI